MTDLSKISAAKLNALIDERFEHSRVTCHACIDAGLGNVRFSELREMAERGDAVASAHVAAEASYHEAINEQRERQAFHGTDKPIRRAA